MARFTFTIDDKYGQQIEEYRRNHHLSMTTSDALRRIVVAGLIKMKEQEVHNEPN